MRALQGESVMPPPVCTEEEFIKVWREHGNPAAVAAALGISIRNVFSRRRKIENAHDITLHSDIGQGSVPNYRHAPQHAARKHVEIENGVAVVFSDAHFWPGVRTTAFRALLVLIRELKPKTVVCNGDAFDGASISRFPRIGWDSKPSVIEELKACKECLEIIEDVAGKAKLYWPLGNHDARFENKLAQNAPQFEGITGFHLKDHFPAWVPCWSVWINGDVVVKHRMRGGIHATRNNTLNAGTTIVTGHLHSLKVTPLTDYRGNRWGVDTGTLADPNGPQFVDYLEDNSTDWRSGFVVLTFHQGRLLWPEVVYVLDDTHVSFRGRIIEV